MAKGRTTRPRNSSNDSVSSATDGKQALTVKSPEKTKRAGRRAKTALSKRRASKVDALKPKKPPTAFFYFLDDFRKEFQVKNPDIKSMRDIGKACGDKWKTMSYDMEEKVHYYDIATEKRAEFDMAMADFVKKKASVRNSIFSTNILVLTNKSNLEESGEFD